MKHTFFPRGVLLALVAMLGAACTMKDQQPPGIIGPSEFGTSLTISITPDILPQDGASQSVVTVTARGVNGQTLPNVTLRAEILVGGVPADFGSLSSRNLVTGNDGRAMVVYTAPLSAPVSVDAFTIVDIGITPVGSDFGNSAMRLASLRLVPRGLIVVPAGLQPAFTVTPTGPTANQTVLFDASTSQSPANNPIASYSWNFGDGRTASGRTVTHSYGTPGTYVARLTIADAIGRSADASQSVTVSAGANPVAAFTFSPTGPVVNQQVNFNGVQSTPAPGRHIVSYVWDFGDGNPQASGQQVSRTFSRVGTYTVTLTVTDDAGRPGSVSLQVAIVAP